MSPAEVILWGAIRRSAIGYKFRRQNPQEGYKLGGAKFRRQAVLPPFIADFLCPSARLIVEVDGDTHDAGKDRLRDDMLEQRGLRVLRVTNLDVMTNLEGVWHAIRSALASPLPFRGGAGGGASTRAMSLDLTPHPNPSPEGEGL